MFPSIPPSRCERAALAVPVGQAHPQRHEDRQDQEESEHDDDGCDEDLLVVLRGVDGPSGLVQGRPVPVYAWRPVHRLGRRHHYPLVDAVQLALRLTTAGG
ncbi:hypothetical protein GCM10027184_00020 [Saccharothrix stipae]